jgi:hypothetical protein
MHYAIRQANLSWFYHIQVFSNRPSPTVAPLVPIPSTDFRWSVAVVSDTLAEYDPSANTLHSVVARNGRSLLHRQRFSGPVTAALNWHYLVNMTKIKRSDMAHICPWASTVDYTAVGRIFTKFRIVLCRNRSRVSEMLENRLGDSHTWLKDLNNVIPVLSTFTDRSGLNSIMG